MKIKRKIIEINEELCDGCGQCVPDCAEGSLQVIDGKAKLVADNLCDGLGACLGACPTGALKIIEREADEFDEEAVEEFLKAKKEAEEQAATARPSSTIQSSNTQEECQSANKPAAIMAKLGDGTSSLSNWPIQIRLVPPNAPFLKNADLLIVADCAPAAYPNFHEDFIKGRVVMMGCPKFDDKESYVQKFAEIFQTADIKSITTTIMEVPCCGSMRGIISEAMRRAGKNIPTEEVIISANGKILSKEG